MKTIVLSAFGLSLAAHVAMAGQAATGPRPVPLADAALDQVQGGQLSSDLSLAVFKNVQAQDLKQTLVDARVRSESDIRGNTALAESGATATGENSFTDTLTLVDAVQGQGSASYSEGVAAVGVAGPTP